MQYKVAIVGEKDIVYAFGMLGMNVFYTTDDAKESRKMIHQIIKDNYGVIFVTDNLAQVIPDIIQKYDDAYMPAFITIPSDYEGQSLGLQRIQENVKKAVGINIL